MAKKVVESEFDELLPGQGMGWKLQMLRKPRQAILNSTTNAIWDEIAKVLGMPIEEQEKPTNDGTQL